MNLREIHEDLINRQADEYETEETEREAAADEWFVRWGPLTKRELFRFISEYHYYYLCEIELGEYWDEYVRSGKQWEDYYCDVLRHRFEA